MIITKEYLYQYHAHCILKKAKSIFNDYEIETTDFKTWLETPAGKAEIAELFLNDIDEWCGLDEAINNEN